MASEDRDSDEEEYRGVEDVLAQDMVRYRVRYSQARHTEEVDFNKKEDIVKKRWPASRSGNNPGRVKRVVSCKRKTHRLAVNWRKQQPAAATGGRNVDMTNKENERVSSAQDMEQEIFHMDPLDLPPAALDNPCRPDAASSGNLDYITEMSKDHGAMAEVLFGRNLRLSVAFTLWRRNAGELLTYFLRTQDMGAFVDFLPVITKSIKEESPNISIGWCVDFFPLVRKVLTSPYEEYVLAGLRWVESVLKNWWEELAADDGNETVNHPSDRNVQVFKQQLLDLWKQEPYLSLVSGTEDHIAAVVDTYLSQLP